MRRILILAGAAVFACLGNPLQIQAQSSSVFGFFYRQEFMQVGDFVFTNLPVQTALWEVWARGFPEGELTEASVTTSQGNAESLTCDSQGAYGGGLATEFPPGACSLSLARADDSTFTVDVTVPAPAYPSPPSFRDMASTVISAGTDLTFALQPGADATAEDYLLLTITAFNSQTFAAWEFHTPWPGQEGALSGRATNVTVPGRLLRPMDKLQVRLISYRATSRQPSPEGLALAGSASGVFAMLEVPDQPQDADVTQYRLLSGRVFVQESQAAPVAASTGGFAFNASAWARATGRLTNLNVSPPGGGSLALLADADGILWETNLVFDREDRLRTVTPVGKYRWTFEGTAQGRQQASLDLTAAPWPPAIQVLNVDELQTHSFTDDVVIRWNAVPGATTNDLIELTVVDAGGNVMVREPDPAGDDPPLVGTATQLTLDEGSIVVGRDYAAFLRFIKVLGRDTNTITGATGLTGVFAETRFPLATKAASPVEVLSTTLPAGEVGVDYWTQLTVIGGRRPYTWVVVAGALPPGLALEPSTGVLSGVPGANGQFDFSVEVRDVGGRVATQPLVNEITGQVRPLELVTTSLPTVTAGIFYFAELAISGGVPPYWFEVGSGRLPGGLELQGCCGVISGRPAEAGEFVLRVRVSDGIGQTSERDLTLSVPAAALEPPVRITGWERRAAGLARKPAAGTDEPSITIALALAGEENDPYTIERSVDLVRWTPAFGTNLPASGRIEWSESGPGPAFYRVRFGQDAPEPDPLWVGPVLDAARATRGQLTTNGLSLRLTNAANVVFELTIPTNAVIEPVEITMTLIEGLNGLPLRGAFLGGVELKPEGLDLLKAGMLTARFPSGPPAEPLAVTYRGNGWDCHLYPQFLRGQGIAVPILSSSGVSGRGQGRGYAFWNLASPNLHTSGRGAQPTDASDLNELRAHQPCYPGENNVAEVLRRYYPDMPPRDELWPPLQQWRDSSVLPNLKSAESSDKLLDKALREWLRWEQVCQLLGLGDDEMNQTARNSAARGLRNAINQASARCTSNYDPGEAGNMLRYARAAGLLGLDSGVNTDELWDRMSRCLRFELTLESLIDVDSGKWFEQVRSGKAVYQWSPETLAYTLTKPAPLNCVFWHLDCPENRCQPVIGTGELNPVWMKISTEEKEEPPPSEENPCDSPSGQESEKRLTCVFTVREPVQAMKVWTEKGWKEIPCSMEMWCNWRPLFVVAHIGEYGGEACFDPETGQGVEHCFAISEKWDILGKRIYARATYEGPVQYSSGKANETTLIELYHAPLPAGAGN